MKTVKLSLFRENPDNPQTVTPEAFADLMRSIERDPARLELRKIAYVTDYTTANGETLSGCIVIDGNKRLRALKAIHGESASVPASWFYDMTSASEEERKRWLVRANIQSGEWDADALAALYTPEELADITTDEELEELWNNLDQETAQTGTAGSAFTAPHDLTGQTAPPRDDAAQTNDAYKQFTDKFIPQKTTDDCYTPEPVYKAVADYVAKRWSLDPSKFVRPFYPGGNYETYDYPAGGVVVDNPPFSILSKILRFYMERGIPFFLFAPALTLFSNGEARASCYIPLNVSVTYENGANVSTSFVTSLSPNLIETEPELYKLMEEANEAAILARGKPVLMRHAYPPDVWDASRLGRLSRYGQTLELPRDEAVYIRKLDAQGTEAAIFGGGFLVSQRAAAERAAAERAAAERAAAHVWTLSEREKEMQMKLDKGVQP